MKKNQIWECISLGKTEEALDILEQLNSNAILLKARFNNGEKQLQTLKSEFESI